MSAMKKIAHKTKRKKVRIFVILGSLQAVAVENIVNKESGYVNICFINSSVSVRSINDCEVFVVSSASFLKVAREYTEIYRAIKLIRKIALEIHVFIPHPYHAISNYMAFYAQADTINLLPDGLLNYYESNVSGHQHREMITKKLLFLLGGAYTCYRGNLTGMEKLKYDSHYVFSSRSIVTKVGKQRLISLPNVVTTDDACKVFILDQPLETLTPIEAKMIRDSLSDYLGKDNGNWIYKPHRNQDVENIVLETTSSLKLHKTSIAEYVIQDFKIMKIVGIFSSALITLKIMYPEIPCAAVGFNEFMHYQPELEKAAKAMSDFGIELVKTSSISQ